MRSLIRNFFISVIVGGTFMGGVILLKRNYDLLANKNSDVSEDETVVIEETEESEDETVVIEETEESEDETVVIEETEESSEIDV